MAKLSKNYSIANLKMSLPDVFLGKFDGFLFVVGERLWLCLIAKIIKSQLGNLFVILVDSEELGDFDDRKKMERKIKRKVGAPLYKLKGELIMSINMVKDRRW